VPTPTRRPLTQISYYGYDPTDPRNNRTGLIAWGVIFIVIGCISALIGLLSIASALAMSAIPTRPGMPMPHIDAHTIISASALYLFTAAILISFGIGSCLSRRWVRPLIIITTVICIFSGFLGVITMVLQAVTGKFSAGGFTAITTTPAGAPAVPQGAILMAMIVGAVFAFLAMVLFPVAVLYFYAKSSTREKLLALDPAPNWTDRLPVPALGWAIGCLFFGISMLLATLNGFSIFFNHLLIGPPAVIQLVVTGLLLILSALLCYTHPHTGWRLTFIIATLLALSSIVYAIAGDPAELQQYMAAKLAAYGLRQSTPPGYLGAFSLRTGGLLYYCSAFAYGIYVRRFFTPTEKSIPTP